MPPIGLLERLEHAFEGERIDPAVRSAQRQTPFAALDRLLADELAQPVHGRLQGPLRRLGIRPQQVYYLVFAHLLAAERDERFQELQRFLLRFGGELERSILDRTVNSPSARILTANGHSSSAAAAAGLEAAKRINVLTYSTSIPERAPQRRGAR